MGDNPEAEKLPEYAVFDVLRFALASQVMLYHMQVLTWSGSGNLAVQIFFALSGWLIGGILYRTDGPELSRFYYNRSTRIWIPYLFTVTALYLISRFHEPIRSPRWLEFLGYDLTFTHNWFTLRPDAALSLAQMPLKGTANHFWSLAVEEQFYLFAPLIITLLPFGRKLVTWLCLASLLYFSGSEYASVGFGVLAAVIAAEYPDWHLRRTAQVVFLLVALAAAVAMASSRTYAFAAPWFAVCVVLLCAQDIRRTALTRWLGGISFPFYLNAWIGTFILHAVEKHFGMEPRWYLLPVEFAAGLAAGAGVYQLIDVQIMARRNRHYRPAVGWALGAMGYLLVITGVLIWTNSHPAALRPASVIASL
jgi:peptidoglycan/LPS O-acetylase OafA/YrhL